MKTKKHGKKKTAKYKAKHQKKAISAYAASGVNRDAGDELVGRIKKLTRARKSAKVKANISGYASLYEVNGSKSPKRYIAASTDGVGTKLRLAFENDSHGTVGVDLVAMSVNDLLCVGATPSFFLDYFATGKLKPKLAERVIAGIVEGCDQSEIPLVGGETAEMPSFYADGEYDLAGFAVGQVGEAELLPRKISPGDVLIGISSSGFHSNGYSLLRKLHASWKPGKSSPTWTKKKGAVAKALLSPTTIYVKSLLPLLRAGKIKGLAHITGSGYLNVPRLSEEVSYEIHLPPLSERPKIYEWLFSEFSIDFEELAQTFNLGIGMVVAVAAKDATSVLSSIKKSGEKAWLLGHALEKKRGTPSKVLVTSKEGTTLLTY